MGTASSAAAWAWWSAKITRAIERAIELRQPVVVVCCSGGARMMEGTLSLMQMAKIGAALGASRPRGAAVPVGHDRSHDRRRHGQFAMLGDLSIAEPKGLIGFAGPRVIEQTIRRSCRKDSSAAVSAREGAVDLIVDRRAMKATIAHALRVLSGPAAPHTGGTTRRTDA